MWLVHQRLIPANALITRRACISLMVQMKEQELSAREESDRQNQDP